MSNAPAPDATTLFSQGIAEGWRRAIDELSKRKDCQTAVQQIKRLAVNFELGNAG